MLNDIREAFKIESDPLKAEGMSAYMKGQFEYFGVISPVRKDISKLIFPTVKKWERKEILHLCTDLWNQPERELHYLSQEILAKTLLKKWKPEDIDFLEWLVLTNSWWDTVDFIAPKLLKSYFDLYPKERKKRTDKWIASKNIWLIRSAILIQLKTKKDTNFELLFSIILSVNATKEFFINKAIGWVLRENAKHSKEIILDFVREHRDELSNLSVREALKHFPNE